MEAVVFPDVEAELVAWLTGELAARGDTAVVATEVPNPRPTRGVRIVRIGGVEINLANDEPRIAFECYDDDVVAASSLARTVRALVRALRGPFGAAWCDLVRDMGLVFKPDLQAGQPRYVVTAEMRVLGSAL